MSLLFTIISGSIAQAGADDLEYFKQFIYRKEEVGNDPDFPEYQYRYLMMKWNDMVQMPDGRYLNPSVSIRMYEDQTFLMVYKENYFQTPDSQQFMPGPCKKITGKWSVPDKQLMLEGVGYADRSQDEFGGLGIKLTYTQNLNSPGLQGHSVIGGMGYGMETDFCF